VYRCRLFLASWFTSLTVLGHQTFLAMVTDKLQQQAIYSAVIASP